MDVSTKRPRSISERYDHGTDGSHEERRVELRLQLKARFENIFHRFEKDFTGIGDEIDLGTGKVIVNNGHLINMQDEHDTASGSVHLSGETGSDRLDSYIDPSIVSESERIDSFIDRNSSDTDSVLGEQTGVDRRTAEEPSTASWHSLTEATSFSNTRSINTRSPSRGDYQCIVARSQSPYEMSLWESKQASTGHPCTKKHCQTPWNSYNNALLLHLRTIEKLSFAQMEHCFPGRKGPAIRAHFLSICNGRGQEFSDTLDEAPPGASLDSHTLTHPAVSPGARPKFPDSNTCGADQRKRPKPRRTLPVNSKQIHASSNTFAGADCFEGHTRSAKLFYESPRLSGPGSLGKVRIYNDSQVEKHERNSRDNLQQPSPLSQSLSQPPKATPRAHTKVLLRQGAHPEKITEDTGQVSRSSFANSNCELPSCLTLASKAETNSSLVNKESPTRTPVNLTPSHRRGNKIDLTPTKTITTLNRLSPNGTLTVELPGVSPAYRAEDRRTRQISSNPKLAMPRDSRRVPVNGDTVRVRSPKRAVTAGTSGKAKRYDSRGKVIPITSLLMEGSEDEFPDNIPKYTPSTQKQHDLMRRDLVSGKHQNRNCDGRTGSNCNRSFCLNCMLLDD